MPGMGQSKLRKDSEGPGQGVHGAVPRNTVRRLAGGGTGERSSSEGSVVRDRVSYHLAEDRAVRPELVCYRDPSRFVERSFTMFDLFRTPKRRNESPRPLILEELGARLVPSV